MSNERSKYMELKKLRKEKGFTQGDMAIKCEVSLTSYQLWERGVTKPNEENMVKLKKVLNLEE